MHSSHKCLIVSSCAFCLDWLSYSLDINYTIAVPYTNLFFCLGIEDFTFSSNF